MKNATRKMNCIELSIPSRRENIRVVENFIESARSEYNINEDIYGNMMVAVTESVSNAIIHGNRQDENKQVCLRLDMNSSKICIEVSDEGPGYDFENVPDPTAPENIEKPGGRGIFLMKHLCDHVEFLDQGKKVQLFFNV